MPKEFEKKVAGGKTVAYPKKKQSEDVERIKAFFGRSSLVEGKHKEGCSCGFCRNKGSIGDWKKKNAPKEEPEEPKAVEEAEGLVKQSKGIHPGKANQAYNNMTSKQAMTPGFKPKAYIKAAGEVAGLPGKGQMGGFKNKSEGEMTGGKRVPKTRRGESVRNVVAALLDG